MIHQVTEAKTEQAQRPDGVNRATQAATGVRRRRKVIRSRLQLTHQVVPVGGVSPTHTVLSVFAPG